MTLLRTGVVVLSMVIPLSQTMVRAAELKTPSEYFVYIGTYTGKKSQGIYVSRLDAATGKLSAPELAAETPNPTFLATFPRQDTVRGQHYLYAANEIAKGAVTAYALDNHSGKLSLLNQQSSGGNGPCHLSTDVTGKCLLVANYGSGSIAALSIKNDGALGLPSSVIQHSGASVNKSRQEGPHAHWIDVDPENKVAFTCDLGLDKVFAYKLDSSKGVLTTNEPAFSAVKPGAGPRHLAFHPNHRFAYLINELDNTVVVFSCNAKTGDLKEIQTISTLPKDFSGESTTAELEVHPSGKFLYGSNRGHDSIVVYSINQKSGKLDFVEHQSTQGKTPRNFAIDPTGRWLLAANQGSDNVFVYRVDQKTGRLQPTGQSIEVGAPVCIKFVAVR